MSGLHAIFLSHVYKRIPSHHHAFLSAFSCRQSALLQAMIDFGDFTYTLRVYDLAICVGYNIMEKESYVQAAADIVQGRYILMIL